MKILRPVLVQPREKWPSDALGVHGESPDSPFAETDTIVFVPDVRGRLTFIEVDGQKVLVNGAE